MARFLGIVTVVYCPWNRNSACLLRSSFTTVDCLRIEFNPRLTWVWSIGKSLFHLNPELVNPTNKGLCECSSSCWHSLYPHCRFAMIIDRVGTPQNTEHLKNEKIKTYRYLNKIWTKKYENYLKKGPKRAQNLIYIQESV
jgi:hypothetical protein